jgi:Mn-dependent DtxR family transcriptional regulator
MVLLLCKGLSTKEIAQKLGISPKTVTNHRTNLTAKTRARNTADMVCLAMTAERIKIQLRQDQDLTRSLLREFSQPTPASECASLP